MTKTNDQITNLDAELDGLSSPTTADTYVVSKDYDPDVVAASAARRALGGGGGGGGGTLPVVGSGTGNVGDVVGVVYNDPTVAVVGGTDKDTPLTGNGAVLTDAYAQWNGNGAGLYWNGNGTDGEQSLLVNTDAGQTKLHDADGNMSPAGTVIDLPDPTNAQDAATKAYADTKIAQGGTLSSDLDVGANDLLNVASIVGAGPTHSVQLVNGTESVLLAYDDGLALGGASVPVGFYGTTPIPKQTGVAVDAAAIHAALVNLGLIGA